MCNKFYLRVQPFPSLMAKTKYDACHQFPPDLESFSQSSKQAAGKHAGRQTHIHASTCSDPRGAFSLYFSETLISFTEFKRIHETETVLRL